MVRISVSVVLLALLADTAVAASKPQGNWVSKPTREDESNVLPLAAIKAGGFALGVMKCAVGDDGNLSGCAVIREMPVGVGVGAAALALTPKFRRKPPRKGDPREVSVAIFWGPYDTPPDWLRRPSPNELLAVYPTQALKRGTGGSAVISCLVTPQGALNECVTAEESPVGSGFGGAGIALTPQFLMKPATHKGRPVVSLVSIPITWPNLGAGFVAPQENSRRVLPPNISWAEAPSYADVAAAYPSKAREQRKAGRATMRCDVSPEGRLVRCSTATAEPRNYGFEDAAKALAKRFRIEVGSEEAAKLTRTITVHLPVAFDPRMLDAATPVVGKPTWSATPGAAATLAAFGPLQLSEAARVSLLCTVQQGGGVAACKVANEGQIGAGLGKAALALAPSFRLATWTVEGLPTVGGEVNIPIRYEPTSAPQ